MSNYPINRTDFKLIVGVQNEIQFFVRNIDRQPIIFPGGTTLTLNIVDVKSTLLLITKPLTITNAQIGLFKATILASDTVNLQQGNLRYSVSVTRPDTSVVMLYTDNDYSCYSTLEVINGPLLTPSPAVTLDPTTFMHDSVLFGGTPDPTLIVSSTLPGAAQSGYTNGLHTISASLVNFSGKISIQGSLISQPATDSDWFLVTTNTYSLVTGNQSLNVQGNFLWTRIVLWSITSGSVSQILYKN